MIVEKCSGFGEEVDWAVGIRSFNTLFKRYPDLNFWEKFTPFSRKYPLFVYLGGKGAEYVNQQYEQYLVDKAETEKYNLQSKPVGEIVVPKKPISLIEFLNNEYPNETKDNKQS
jgi:hypothetical protein